MAFLAHSAKRLIPEQLYQHHVEAVNTGAVQNITEALQFFSGAEEEKAAILKAVACGAMFHDIGKLDEKNQEVLSKLDSMEKLPLNHCDAGTSWLLKNGVLNGAMLVYCHHAGLFSLSDEMKKNDGSLLFRDVDIAGSVDDNLQEYLIKHFKEFPSCEYDKDTFPLKGLSLRISLSCLVDADHHDTARHYGDESIMVSAPPRWEERLKSLCHYVDTLQCTSAKDIRNLLRRDVYDACLTANHDSPLKCCDAPVGSGKTTAIIAHLLAVSKAKSLRHIIVVLPYTNIIEQSVKVYRDALVLEGENPEDIVAAHYHQADFSNLSSRHLATLWRTPIVVTSAVQFFETLSNCKTSRLRKLHELPGVAVFVDESHAAMPLHIWPQQWDWLKELTEKWGGYFVLASGSLVKFWEFASFSSSDDVIPNLLPDELRMRLKQFENRRIVYPERKSPLGRDELIEFVLSKSGPRLVILNTVQSAAVIANEMRINGENTLHLSTALTPLDRKKIIDLVYSLLQHKSMSDWTLVATSCVEAGVDFSFKTAFRESCSVTSLIQTGGRANRQGIDLECEVFDFRVRDPFLNQHPAFDTSRLVLNQIFDEGLMSRLSPMELATESIRRELGKSALQRKIDEINKNEREQNYREVAKLTRIIDADTRTVVISSDIVEKLKKHEKVSSVEILQNSIQLWSKKINEIGLQSFDHYDDLFFWGGYPYDPDFLGYMEGLLPMVYKYEGDEYGLIL